MELRHIKYFIAVARELNIGRAAARLHISQPPLTRQIQQLEEELGVQLFVRTPKGVELTQAGRLMLAEAENIQTVVSQTVDRVQRAAKGHLGRLDVAVFGSGVLLLIPRVLLAFRTAHPGVTMAVQTMGKTEQIEALRQRRITVGFNRLLAPEPDIASELFAIEPVMVAINALDPLATQEEIGIRDLAGKPMVMYPSTGRPNFVDKVHQLFATERLHPTVAHEVGDAVTAVAFVASGFGVCLVAESATALTLPSVVYRRLKMKKPATVDLSCIYRVGDESPILGAFLEVMRGCRGAGVGDLPG